MVFSLKKTILTHRSKNRDYAFGTASLCSIFHPLFEWVIKNLCKNAIDAMAGAGRIDLYVFRSGSHVVIEVTDTGKGIPARHVRDVFSSGYTT